MDYPSVYLKLSKEFTNSPAYSIVNVLDVLHIPFWPFVSLATIPMVIHHPLP